MKGKLHSLVSKAFLLTIALSGLAHFSQAQTVIMSSSVNNGGFESNSASPWVLVNPSGNGSTKWAIDNSYKCSGTKAAYITTANNAGNNSYTTGTSAVAHLYADISVPAYNTSVTVSFDWKSGGESALDYFNVYKFTGTLPTPSAGTLPSATGLLGGPYFSNPATTTCTNTTLTFTVPSSASVTTVRLIFSWTNNNSGGNGTGATVDNVTVTSDGPPNCPTPGTPSNGSTSVCPTGTTLTWTAATSGSTAISYNVYFGTSATPPLVTTTTGTSYSTGALASNTTYYWSVVPVNSYGSPSSCSVQSFTTINTSGSCSLGTGVYSISLPYSITGQTTCGMVNDLTSSNVTTCGSTLYLGGEDVVYYFTPTSSGNITISLTSTGSYTGIMLYNGCPLSSGCYASAVSCVAYAQSYAGNQSICASVTAGTTYYLIIDSWPSPTCNPYGLTITAASGTPAGTTCSNPVNITLPYSATGESTACMGNDYTSASTGSCGTSYESGEDKVYKYVATGSECISIQLSNATTTSIGYQIYSGCPGTAGTTCIGSNGGSNPLVGSVTLPSAGTYYIVVDTWSTPFNASYDISITSLGSGPSNDLPCNATSLGLNVYLTGNNQCSGSGSEPASPSCWYAGTLNTVWYTVTCPASGELKIRTINGTLTNTQIALYSGSCGSLTLVTGACNDDAPACGGSYYSNSELTVTGLTAGTTYYVRVDGYSSLTGTFDIIAVDNTIGFPAAAGQDCFIANPVCNQTISVGNPGYQAYGNNCDFTGSGICLASGERGSAWYTIPINTSGNLTFDIVPNDWPGAPSTSGTDYDFAVWKVTGTGSTTCAGILAGAVPIRCNYSGLGVTGCYGASNGTAPAAYPGFGGAYMSQIPVVAGEVYVLVISNFSNSTAGFTLTFGGTSTGPVNYTTAATSVNWSGGTSNSWPLASNWGGCNIPSCGVDAICVPSSTTQPVIAANTTATVKNLTINPGSTLTIQAGATLNICGDFTNNGNLVADPTSTIIFSNASVIQNMNGSMVGSDKFGNLQITGMGVSLNQNLDVGGSFTVNSGSVFNTNGYYMKVAGNFTAAGSTSFTNVTGTLEFNGTSAQNYTPGGALTLNNVVMNHTGTGVTLVGNNMVLGTSGVLTLTQGKIITNALEVQVNNTAAAAVSTGNTTSFVQGYLRRKLSSTGSFNFPVGEATKGYQRANITFTSATTIDNLLASFVQYGSVPAALGLTECATTYNMPALNNGKWIINAYNSSNVQIAATGNGTYDMTLYNLLGSYNNQTGANGWTVMKDPGSGWGLDGTCVISGINSVQRVGMTGFSSFGTAQATAPLPIELLSFTGKNMGNANLLEWTTATETNNDYFTLEHSKNGISFEEITRVDGAGSSTSEKSYSAKDNYPYGGVTYYRLKQTDFDGNFTHSAVIALENKFNDITVENIHPNPTNGDINFDLTMPEKGMVTIEIMDAFGKLVHKKVIEAVEGRNSLTTEMTNLAQGIYTLKVSFAEGNYTSVSKVVKY
jgi:hypothetical protein